MRVFERRACASHGQETFVLDETAGTAAQRATMVAYLLEQGYIERDDALVSSRDRNAANVRPSSSVAVVED